MLRDFDGYRPLSEAQSGLWFIHQSAPDSPMLNNGEYYDMRGPVDAAALERSVAAVVRESEILRTRFVDTDQGPAQRIDPGLSHPMARVDLREAPDPMAAALELMRAELAVPLDPTRDNLYAHTLFHLGPEHYLWFQRAHHLLVDGYTFMLLARRVAELYSAQTTGAEVGASPGSFLELLDEAEAYVDGSEREADTRYWSGYLRGAPHHTALTDRREAPGRHYIRATRVMDEQATARIGEVARRCGTGWKQFLMATVAVYTHKWTGENDILLSLPVAARTTELSRRTPGMSSNVIPLRLDVSPSAPVSDVARDVAATLRACLPHQRHPVAATRRLLGQTPRAPREFGPLINIMSFDYDVDFGDLACEPHNIFQGPIEELRIDVLQRRRGGALHIDFDANPAVFTPEELERRADSFVRLLDALCEAPLTPIAELDLLTQEERHRILDEFGVGAWSADTGQTVHEIFEARAGTDPDAVALPGTGACLTYGELNARANRLARYLRELGMGPGDLVGVLLQRGEGFAEALIGVLKTGAGYVPLDPAFPDERLATMVRVADVRSVVTTRRLAERVPAESRAILLDAEHERIGTQALHDLGVAVSPDAPACVMFTSGSTGEPKGVVAPHRAIVSTLLGQDYLDFGPEQVWLQTAPVSWDAFVLEFWGALLHGSPCVLQPGQKPEPALMARLCAEHGVTSMWLSAGLFNLVLDENPEVFEGLRQVITGGEAPSVEHMRRFLETRPAVRLQHGYGPVESMVFTHSYQVTMVDGTLVPVGAPIAHRTSYVLDERLRPVPAGVPGELYVGGDGLALGYVGRPDLTAERFLPDPFAGTGERMYRTGDLVRWNDRGEVEFLGRVDDQVKVRGFRIEPAEVESALMALSGVAKAAVVVREDRPGDRRLVAYVVPAEAARPEPVDLRSGLSSVLPDHMVPSAVVVLTELPLNANGKLDRRALPEPERTLVSAGREPRDLHEEILCGVFGDILGLDGVGVDDSFFDLGGDSLLATRLVGRVRGLFNTEIALREVFTAPTVAGLADRIRSCAQGPERPALVRAERPERVPLSFAQRRLWFLHRLEGPSATYNVPITLRLTGPVDHGALREALGDVVRRHESLRTVFPSHEGEPYQCVLDRSPELEVVQADEAALEARIEDAVGHAFDLERELPIRAWSITTGHHESTLVVVLHHIAGDGWSMRPLMDDLAAAYGDRLAGREPDWSGRPELTVQYVDYTLWQRESLNGLDGTAGTSDTRLLYWCERLAGSPEVLDLPTDRPRPAVASYRGETVDVDLSGRLHGELKALAAAHGVTLFMVLQAALAVTLSRSGAGQDIPIGTPVAGREDPALDDLVGFFVNTLVLRTRVEGDVSFSRMLEEVRETDLAAFEHQEVPFERVVEALAPERSGGHHPLFQVMLVLQNNTEASTELPGTKMELTLRPPGSAKFDLTLDLRESGVDEGVEGTLEFATDLFDRDTALAL
uniref:non-ribosomal peptide synthetase n=1 Tax=Nocardiopsis alkaliphila TaxID=225762 RepID=UPI0003737F3C